MGLCLRRLRLQYPLQGWQGSSGISGSFQAESVATFDWNRWQVSTGISGNLRAEYAAMFTQVVKTLQNSDENTVARFLSRLVTVVRQAEGIGWGYYDAISDTLEEAFPQ